MSGTDEILCCCGGGGTLFNVVKCDDVSESFLMEIPSGVDPSPDVGDIYTDGTDKYIVKATGVSGTKDITATGTETDCDCDCSDDTFEDYYYPTSYSYDAMDDEVDVVMALMVCCFSDRNYDANYSHTATSKTYDGIGIATGGSGSPYGLTNTQSASASFSVSREDGVSTLNSAGYQETNVSYDDNGGDDDPYVSKIDTADSGSPSLNDSITSICAAVAAARTGFSVRDPDVEYTTRRWDETGTNIEDTSFTLGSGFVEYTSQFISPPLGAVTTSLNPTPSLGFGASLGQWGIAVAASFGGEVNLTPTVREKTVTVSESAGQYQVSVRIRTRDRGIYSPSSRFAGMTSYDIEVEQTFSLQIKDQKCGENDLSGMGFAQTLDADHDGLRALAPT